MRTERRVTCLNQCVLFIVDFLPVGWRRPEGSLGVEALPADGVVDGEDFWLAGFDSGFGKDRHEVLSVGAEAFFGVPDFADFEVSVGAEAAVVFAPR